MTTFVGTQTKFGDAVNSLIELEYNALEAYQAAINRVHNLDYKAKLEEFAGDHKRHIHELSKLAEKHGQQPPHEPSLGKQWLAKGKVVIANLMGDETVLQAMLSNEGDTVTAYERMNKRTDKWDDAEDLIQSFLEDERKHRSWLEGITA